MKKAMLICGIMVAGHDLYSEPKPDVEAVMYLDTEMPCWRGQMLDGRIVIRNNGDDDIKLMKSEMSPAHFVYGQLYIRMDVSEEEEMRLSAKPATRWITRFRIKENTDYEVQEGGGFVTLQKGESFETDFAAREVTVPHGAGNMRVPMVAELYLSPDRWVPVEVRPPISVAGDAKFTPLTPIETGPEWDRTSVRLTRVQIGTNEFLHAKLNSAVPFLRLADLHPDDVVVHSNKVITITQKNGTVRTIPEADIPRISAERAEEKRKAREKEMGGN